MTIKILALLALLPAIVVSPTIVQAAGKPLTIALSPSTVTVTEGQSASFTLSKSGGNGQIAPVKVTTSDGSWSGSVVPGMSFAISTIDDSVVNGTRTIIVTAVASTGATARATITELDNDVAPPAATWTKCADENGICTIIGTAQVRYGSGSTWTPARSFTGSIDCSNTTFGDPLFGTAKECDTTGTLVAPAPAPVPAPVPAPAPTSTDNPLVGQAPGVGAPDIPTTDHDINNDLQPAWGTGAIPPKEAVIGALRFLCRHTTLAADDPTVSPGQPNASHLHDQTGVYGWNAFSNYGNLRTGGGGSGCNDVAGADKNPAEVNWSANRTPYWQPALLDGKGYVILADYTSYYYKARPYAGPLADPIVTDPANAQYLAKGVPLPNGIKFIFGANLSAMTATNFRFSCTLPISNTDYPTMAEAIQCVKANSAAGAQLEVHQDAPGCWDGINLDTADHRSHLAYPSYGSWGYQKCDAQHPYVIPTFTYAVFYTILPSDDGDIHFSSDEMDNSKPRGWSFHVDYGPQSWDPTVLKMWLDGCINMSLDCSGGDLGNGKQLKGASQPIYFDPATGTYTPAWRNPWRLVPIPPPTIN